MKDKSELSCKNGSKPAIQCMNTVAVCTCILCASYMIAVFYRTLTTYPPPNLSDSSFYLSERVIFGPLTVSIKFAVD